jgi:hypothetical protein
VRARRTVEFAARPGVFGLVAAAISPRKTATDSYLPLGYGMTSIPVVRRKTSDSVEPTPSISAYRGGDCVPNTESWLSSSRRKFGSLSE